MKPTWSASIAAQPACRACREAPRRRRGARRAPASCLLGKGDGAAGFEDVVDDQDVAADDVALDIAEHVTSPGRDGAGPVARQRDELDFGRQPGVMERPDEIGGEDETALQDRDDEQDLVAGRRDFAGDLGIPLGDRVGVEENSDRTATDFRHQRIPT